MEDVLPSQSRSAAAGGCTRCGRPASIWHVCSSCTTRAAMAIDGPSSLSTASGTPTIHCAACRVPLSVPSHYHTVHVLCPPCQALLKPKYQRANPYPVVPPINTSTRTHGMASTVAYTYSQLPASPSGSSSPLSPLGVPGGTWRTYHRDTSRMCMRFGCGVRLPPYVQGDTCEACVRAGFVRPPSAIVPKRAPRRATERACPSPWPRASLDVDARAVSPDVVRTANVPVQLPLPERVTENDDLEGELELDLVYPDDVPVATQSTPTIPEDDDDVELELVYPEDAAIEALQKASSTSHTKPSAPPTLCKLFTDCLQTIRPTSLVQTSAAFSDKSPPRRCRMPGCDEKLSAHTRMERCVKCTIDDWKRRRLASVNTPDASNTSSVTTDASMDANEVLNGISEAEVENGRSSPSSSPSDKPTNEPRPDATHISGWDSDLTDLSDSDSESESISDLDPLPVRPDGVTRPTIRIPLLIHRLPPDHSHRKCGNKRCNIALPKDHQWKMCEPCRQAQRRYQQIRLESQRRRVLGLPMLEPPDVLCRRWRSLSPEMQESGVPLTPETSRQCSARRCRVRIPLPEVYQWKTCTGCRAIARRSARRKRDKFVESRRASSQAEVVPHFPAYQNGETLLSSFDAQLNGFVEGQLVYLRAKLYEDGSRKPKDIPMIFYFVGEYSIVTGQRDSDDDERDGHERDDPRPPDVDTAGSEAMRRQVSSVVSELERVLHTTFRVEEAFGIESGGMVVRFTCELELLAQLRPFTATIGPKPGPESSSASSSDSDAGKDKVGDAPREEVGPRPNPTPRPPAVPLVKTLSGELEAVVVPDESHHLFRGRRIVIRYCMFG